MAIELSDEIICEILAILVDAADHGQPLSDTSVEVKDLLHERLPGEEPLQVMRELAARGLITLQREIITEVGNPRSVGAVEDLGTLAPAGRAFFANCNRLEE
jgi:hypothetical protein